MADSRPLRLELEVDAADEVDPRARSFFLANKELFEYAKFVGRADPFDPTCSSPSRGPSLSFLDRYRACNEQSSAMDDDATYLLAVPALTNAILSIPMPAMASRSPPRASSHAPVTTFSAPPSLVSASSLRLHNRQHQHSFIGDQQLSRVAPYQPGESPTRSLGSPDKRQRFALESFSVGPMPELAGSPTYKQRLEYSEPGRSSPGRWQSVTESSTLCDGSPSRNSQPGALARAQSKPCTFQMPVVSALLIDSSARRQQLERRQVGEGAKIQLLVGSKCVGRVSAATRNLPASIRRRLEASANVAARRERLYRVLLEDYRRLAGV